MQLLFAYFFIDIRLPAVLCRKNRRFSYVCKKKASRDALSIGKKRYSAVNYYAHKINEPYKRKKPDAQNPRNESGYTSRLEKFRNAVYACKSPSHEKFPYNLLPQRSSVKATCERNFFIERGFDGQLHVKSAPFAFLASDVYRSPVFRHNAFHDVESHTLTVTARAGLVFSVKLVEYKRLTFF